MKGAIPVLLAQIDDARSHKWESVESALTGVTEEEARWQAHGYRDEQPEPGWPLPGTILWHVAHMAACTDHYAKCIRLRPSKDVPERAWHPDPSLEGLRTRLRDIQREFRSLVAALTDADLDTPVRGELPLMRFVHMAVRHDVWHASQIAVARRLWRTREKA